MGGCLKQDKVLDLGNGCLYTLDLEKSFPLQGARSSDPQPGALPLDPAGDRRRPPGPPLSGFLTFTVPISENGFRYELKHARVRSPYPDLFILLFFSFT